MLSLAVQQVKLVKLYNVGTYKQQTPAQCTVDRNDIMIVNMEHEVNLSSV